MSAALMLSECTTALNGTRVGADVVVATVGIDTRTLAAGSLYVALRGDQHDGHAFIDAAVENGASALLVERRLDVELPQLIVDDTRLALGALARLWAARYRVPTVAITGSNGKTTVKHMIAAILGQRGTVCLTQGNQNNEIGVPLTLLSLRPEHSFAVVEMGANHIGEIAYLVSLTDVDVAIVNNVEASHLEGFGSLQGVADAKSEIFRGLGPEGTAIINADNPFADVMRKAASHCRQVEFGASATADVRVLTGASAGASLHIEVADPAPGRQLAVDLPLPGKHNIMNALAATAATLAIGADDESVMSGLAGMQSVRGRLQRKPAADGVQLIDDTYNANPASVRSAIDVLASESGLRHLVLGDMGELGDDAARLHRDIGAYAQAAGIDELWTVGTLMAEAAAAFEGGHHFESMDALLSALSAQLTPVSAQTQTVLVKGSRSARMERVVDALSKPLNPASSKTQELSA